MAFEFEARGGAAVDPATGLSIRMPRMQPGDVSSTTEYQYPIYLGEQRIHGVAVMGTDTVDRSGGRRLWTSRLDLGAAGALDGLLELKRMLGNADDDFVFVQGIARGLLLVFATDPNPGYDFHYVAVISVAALAARGITAPAAAGPVLDGGIVLAEVRVPARANGRDVP